MRVRLIKEELDAKEPNERRKRITRRRERLRQADGTDRRTDGRTDGRCWTVWDEMKVELNKHEASEAIRDRAERRGVGRRDGSNGKGLNAELREANGEDYCYYAFINAPQEFFSLVHDRGNYNARGKKRIELFLV